MPAQEVYGVDVGAKELAIARHDPASAFVIPNVSRSITRWLKTLSAPAIIGVESTGRYHQQLAHLAHAAGHLVFVLDPRRLKAYRKALGFRAKTDRRDSELIALYLAREHSTLHAFVPMAEPLAALLRLLRRRTRVVVCRQRLVATLRDSPECAADLRRTRADLDRLIRTIDQQCEKIIAQDPARRARRKRLQTIPGIGPMTSSFLLTMLERTPYVSSDALVAATGLDPRPNDSGARRGQRSLTKRGPSDLRRLLYNGAMAAARGAEPFRTLYAGYRARGLNSTTATVVIARKLVRIAFAVDRSGTPYDTTRLAVS